MVEQMGEGGRQRERNCNNLVGTWIHKATNVQRTDILLQNTHCDYEHQFIYTHR